MNSPKQARPKSTPKMVTLEGGIKIPIPSPSRCTPTSKTMPVLCNDKMAYKAATG